MALVSLSRKPTAVSVSRPLAGFQSRPPSVLQLDSGFSAAFPASPGRSSRDRCRWAGGSRAPPIRAGESFWSAYKPPPRWARRPSRRREHLSARAQREREAPERPQAQIRVARALVARMDTERVAAKFAGANLEKLKLWIESPDSSSP